MSKDLVSERLSSHGSRLDLSRDIPESRGFAVPLTPAELALKRWVDIVVGSLLLVFVLPLAALVAIFVKMDSPGPVFFSQERVGRYGRPFVMLKFRTLFTDRSDREGRFQATIHDPRVTRVGRWLRRTSIDELPQLVNVIKGDMSLVGPRPHAPATEVEGRPFSEALPNYEKRHCLKPGLTGWAQVHGWRGPTPTLKSLENRLEYDLEYIENWSMSLDAIILLRTLGVPFTPHAGGRDAGTAEPSVNHAGARQDSREQEP
ncbi:MAG: exopolysaccharide biosynthesis polyprenyl glycosylphosphotransferase [Geminicoccaceae bacterium]